MNTTERENQPLVLYIKLILLSWFSMIGFDFFLHAGLLSSVYAQPSPFLLPADRAFALIPVGYASFLLLDIFLLWLILKTGNSGMRAGLIFGLQVGIFSCGALALGLYSIATAPPNLLIAWALGQALELGIAGGVIGYGLKQKRLGHLSIFTVVFVILCFVVAVIIQNLA